MSEKPTPPHAADDPDDDGGEDEREAEEPDEAELAEAALPADAEAAEDEPLVPPERALQGQGRALQRIDPLERYMAEVRRYPLISREEEHELAVRYARDGDVDAARRLVTANLRLVV